MGKADSPTIPGHASVVVIGGGIMGCSTLYHLAKHGVNDAVLIERNKLTSGTTWHSAAQVRALRSSRNLTDLIRYSIDLYSSLEAETGQATGWIQEGSLSIATNPDRLIHIRRQEALARLFGVRARSISAAEAKARWPLMHADDVVGAVWSPDDGRVSPSDLCAALVKGARTRGASVFEDTAVNGIQTRSGKVVGVETSEGLIRCDAIAVCAGLWSREVAGMAGVDAPVWPCEHFYLLTRPVAGITGNMPTLSDHDAHLYIRDDSGGLLVGCFEPTGKSIDPAKLGSDFSFQLLEEDWDHFEPMMRNALNRLPILATSEVRMLLNGPESFTPDGGFLLGESTETSGLFLGCGMNSVGVATGGGAGMALAHRIVHGHTPTDLHEVDPCRFPSCLNAVGALTERAPEVLGKHYEITFPGRTWRTARDLIRPPLYPRFKAAGAKFDQVFGYERPQYFNASTNHALTFGKPCWFDQVGEEVMTAHQRCALFDQSTLGKIDIEGRDVVAFLNRVCTAQVDRSTDTAVYSLMLNERGGIESDLTVTRLGAKRYRVMVGSTAIKRTCSWLRSRMHTGERVTLTNRTDELAVIAVAGPATRSVAERMGLESLNQLGFLQSAVVNMAGVQIRGTRLSYVGEPGWELTVAAEDALTLYDVLYAEGARPAGLFAQTAMRIEKGFLSCGHDIDTDLNPLQANLGFTLAWETSFVGHKALANDRGKLQASRLASIILDDPGATPLGGEPVLSDGKIVGKTTSAAFGYRIGRPVAIALFDCEHRNLVDGEQVAVDIAGTSAAGRVTIKCAFDPQGLRLHH